MKNMIDERVELSTIVWNPWIIYNFLFPILWFSYYQSRSPVRCAIIFPLSASAIVNATRELSTISGAGKAEGGVFIYGWGSG